MTTQSFYLDLIPNGIAPIVCVSQYDAGQLWEFNIIKDNQLFTIPTGSSVTVQGTKKDGTGFQYACSYSGSTITVTETQQMTVLSGDLQAELVIVKDDARIATLNFIIRVERAPLGEDTVISETELPLIEEAAELAEHIGEYIAEIEASANKAEAYAVGTIDGIPVPSSDPAYQNNAKYYADNFLGYVTDSQYSAIQTILS